MRFPRAVSQTVPGRPRASFTPVLRPAREVQSLDWDRRGRVTPARPASQEAWPGAEPAGASQLASAAVERRKASAPEARTDGNIRSCGARRAPPGTATQYAPSGAPPPFFYLGRVGRAFLKRAANLGCEDASRERDRLSLAPGARGKLFDIVDRHHHPPPRTRGRGTTRRVVEGASDSTLRCRRRMIVEARAPSTILLRRMVPLPRFSRGRMNLFTSASTPIRSNPR